MSLFSPDNWTRCRETLDRLFEFLNRRELSEKDMAEIKRHIRECPPCGDRFDFEEELIARLKDSDPCQCPDRLRARIRDLLEK